MNDDLNAPINDHEDFGDQLADSKMSYLMSNKCAFALFLVWTLLTLFLVVIVFGPRSTISTTKSDAMTPSPREIISTRTQFNGFRPLSSTVALSALIHVNKAVVDRHLAIKLNGVVSVLNVSHGQIASYPVEVSKSVTVKVGVRELLVNGSVFENEIVETTAPSFLPL